MTMPGTGGTLADAIVRVHADASRVGPEIRRQTEGPVGEAGDHAGSNFGKRMAKSIGIAVAAGVAVVGAGLAKGIQASVKSASDLNETVSKTGVVFGKSAGDVRKWSKDSATALGQSQKSALDAATTFAIYGKAAKLTGKSLVGFSTNLTELASDMASFSNSTPEEAIAAIGSALRGEFDPIERYGVLLNETTTKQEALRLGLIKTTTDALTPQQRVLAVQSLIYKQTSDAQGDFARTSAGLANQQRIAAAQVENLKSRIGQGLLPVAIQLTTVFNTKVIPALNELWSKHGPKVVAFLQSAGEKFAAFITAFAAGDFDAEIAKVTDALSRFGNAVKTQAGPALESIKANVGPASKGLKEDLLPALKQLKEDGGEGLGNAIKVGAVAIGFLAEHADLLAKALPYLVGGIIAFKVAQLAANVAMAISPGLRIAEIIATNRQTAAITANTAARGAETATIVGGTAATVANVGAENLSIGAKIRSAVVEKAKTVATVAGTVAAWAATAATTALGVAMAFVTSPIGIVILIVAALTAAVILLWKKNETFREVVKAVWKAVWTAIKFVGDWFVNTLWPSLKRAFDQLMAVIKFFKDVTVGYWNFWKTAIELGFKAVKGLVFDPLMKLIKGDIPGAFKLGVANIGKIWEGLKKLASVPVKFVIDTVINKGIIGTFNKVSGFFKGPKIGEVSSAGIGDGPGMGRAAGHGHGDGLGAFGGARLPKGAGDGLGDIVAFFRNPASFIKGKVMGKINAIQDSPFGEMLKGAGSKLLGGMIDRVKSLLTFVSDTGGGGGSIGGLQRGIAGVLASVRAAFGNVPLISGFRAGSTTLTGNRSYHASGRAIDIAARREWAAYIRAAFGPQLKELITPWQDLNLLNGRPHTYTGAVWNQHNFAGGNAHIHAALDDGGRRVLRPGMNLIPNGTGRNEPIYGPAGIGEVVAMLAALIQAVERVAPGVGAQLRGAGTALNLRSRMV